LLKKFHFAQVSYSQSFEMKTHHYLACDLGAESGRIILGTLSSKKISLKEVHRFSTGILKQGESFRWDFPRFISEVQKGLLKARQLEKNIVSMSTDSWAVDYAYLNRQEKLIGLPYHYRDPRTSSFYRKCIKEDAELIFCETGIQFLPFNTLFQFLADYQKEPETIRSASQFLTVADYINYLFSGVAKIEESMASTTQLYNPKQRNWSDVLIKKYGFRSELFPEIVPSGIVLGPIQKEFQNGTGAEQIQVIASCSHDTGAAVAAIPSEGDSNWAFISSGTWSLIGVELPAPIINTASQRYNFTNEMGFGGRVRFLKNLMGLWIIQECRRSWKEGGNELSYEELLGEVEKATPFKFLIRPNSEEFLNPDRMPEKIISFCRRSGQEEPTSIAEITRCALESLAFASRQIFEELELVANKKLTRIHIVGGGSQNRLLNQFVSNATRKDVLAGPVEATAIGNVLIQAITLGHIRSLEEARGIVRESFSIKEFHPDHASDWDAAYERFKSLPIIS
jgi:rhamnulokinase